MQLKNFGDMVHLSGPFQLMWNRISFSRLTLLYFFFSVAHFVIQLSFQIKAFTINSNASHFLSRIVNEAQTTNNSLPFLRGSTLRMCSWVPSNLDVDIDSCPVVWNASTVNADAVNNAITNITGNSPVDLISPASVPSSSQAATSSSLSMTSATPSITSASELKEMSSTSTAALARQTVTIFVIPQSTTVLDNSGSRVAASNQDEDQDEDEDDRKRRNIQRDVQVIPSQSGGSVSVTLVGLEGANNVVLDGTCLWSLNWPVSILGNTKREDMVFIGFQFWVLAMSIVALLNESIPHILASLVTHLMATAWASFQISHTANFRSEFNHVITNGACKGIPLLPHYWDARSKAEIPSLALNVVALLISCFLTWKLIKLFGWQTFKRVGASLTINRIYKLVLFLSITIQLSLFFMIVTVSLWIDQLMNSVIGDLVDFQTLYKATSFITLGLLVPWLMTGWFAVRRELRMPMFIFLLLSILYLGGWGVMFFSTTFRWTFITWRFFSIMASASVFLTCLSIILGVICRFNFDKGLARYLNAHHSLPEDDFHTSYGSSDIEKVAFPSSEKPLPTYTSFDDHETVFTHSTHSGSTLGPRFSNKFAEPFETSIPNVPLPPAALKRNSNDIQVHRSDSYGSTKSSGSLGSHNSHARNDSSHSHGSQNLQAKRWVIE